MAAGTNKSSLIRPGNIWPFLLITSLFFLWGLANNMTDTLLAAFKRIMSMSDFQTSWIQLAFYGAYFCLALPAAILIKKYTYKTGILVGLGLFILGSLLFYPASITMALVASRPKVTGSNMEMPASGPIPGSIPTSVPTKQPRKA